ncbi:MAG: hypothetical protein GXO43_02125 [Crenarchaeota archaeon]|nr:hypothetical protein [Thermoproteota archaeon]
MLSQKVLVSILLIASIILASFPLMTVHAAASNAPSLDRLKFVINRAYQYLMRLKRDLGPYTVFAEYPALPVVVHISDLKFNGESLGEAWFIPGIYLGPMQTTMTARDGSISTIKGSNYIQSTYTYYLDIQLFRPDVNQLVTIGTLKVEEVRTYHTDTHTYDAHVKITVISLASAYNLQYADLYVAGKYLGKLGEASSFETSVPETMPSMRTSVRHVDMLAPVLLYILTRNQNLISETATMDDDILTAVFNGNPPSTRVYMGAYYHIYDIYLPIFRSFIYMENIQAPCSDHFWDGKWFNYGVGFKKVLETFETHNFIKKPYPAYPYKSKIVGGAELTHTDGGTLFLSFLQKINDPLWLGWLGLYYAYKGDWNNAINEWNEIVNYWDGIGVKSPVQGNGYSTIRLALALALGSILAGNGKISWTIPDKMAQVLIALQWNGTGHYTNDGKTVYTIVKPDHTGGFLVSYGPIGSFGFVPFRPSLLDNFIKGAGSPPEYLGPIPTNTETTIVSLAALLQYIYWRYDVRPDEILG